MRAGVRFLMVVVAVSVIVLFLGPYDRTLFCFDGEPAQVPGVEASRIDKAIKDLMSKYSIPGGTLAVMKDGRLTYAQGYGFADASTRVHAEPGTLFRIASVSKSITAVAVLKLADEGKLSLDDKMSEIIWDYIPPTGFDIRLVDITVRDLLRHSGGWVSATAGDPQFMSLEIAARLKSPPPPSPQTVVRYWFTRDLQFDPGRRHSYSNFGYNVLGRIIETLTRQSYESYVNSTILMPLGIRRMQIGASLKEQRAKGEGVYHANAGDPLVDSVFPSLGKVQHAYGGWSHEALDAHGGWIASAIDLMRFVRGVEGSGGQPKLLSEKILKEMVAYQNLPGQSPDHYYALGWVVDGAGTASEQWSHTGALEGSNAALMVRQINGVSYAVIFNALPADFITFFDELIEVLKEEIGSITMWPDTDLFPRFP
ncbi:MAG: serine hydrolase domain-containing protein [Acidobacteriota bacterium]